ncbi:MAG: pyridoxamine 5'-phosphate oxidase [Verrucomicrobia bacterium]|nr:pyridoxamine 5'-phosphate oxidase [Verrucomicrobiota bacterium]
MALSPESLAALRLDYSQRGLLLEELDPDPLAQFRVWLAEAHAQQILEPNAMVLSTVAADGQPWSRTVLLKACDARGFAFFTNYDGFKAAHLAVNPRAALTFWWGALERQVNITGKISKTTREESEAYFAQRPLASQLGAWASPQSALLESREELEQRFAEVKARFEGLPVPCPPHWGGYLLSPESIEFWQGRRSRLHDRFRYTGTIGGIWQVQRLAP